MKFRTDIMQIRSGFVTTNWGKFFTNWSSSCCKSEKEVAEMISVEYQSYKMSKTFKKISLTEFAFAKISSHCFNAYVTSLNGILNKFFFKSGADTFQLPALLLLQFFNDI